jgi:hypothetical protein
MMTSTELLRPVILEVNFDIVRIAEAIIRPFALKTIIHLLQETGCNIQQPPRVDKPQIEDIIDPTIYAILRKFNPEELQRIYKAAAYLSMMELKQVIASIFACRVFVTKDINCLEKRRKELKVVKEFNFPNMQQLKKENPELEMTLK